MSLADLAPTFDELGNALDVFIAEGCEKKDGILAHKDCGGGIRAGFLNLFYLNDDGSLDPDPDGFGIGPKKVPYCERCFPPDGFNYTYAVRFPVLKERSTQQKDYVFTWGDREITSGDQTLLLK